MENLFGGSVVEEYKCYNISLNGSLDPFQSDAHLIEYLSGRDGEQEGPGQLSDVEDDLSARH